MDDTIAQTLGVDISKDALDADLYPQGLARRFPNNSKGFKALLAWLAEANLAHIVFEPTGAYHHGFERHLAEAGLPLVKINPRQARRFAEAIGGRNCRH